MKLLPAFILIIASLVLVARCGTGEDPAVDPAVDHPAHSEDMAMEAADPAHNMSIYQVSSEWVTEDGETVTLGTLEGKTQVVAMVYTSCEVACPRIVASMKTIQKKTDSDAVGFVLISIDPERDTPEALKAYAEKMNMDDSAWTLLTGSPDNVLELAALLGVRYRKMADGEFAHSNIITVLDAQGEIVYQQNGLGADLTRETAEFVVSL